MTDTVDTMELWFDFTPLNERLSNPDDEENGLTVKSLLVPIFPDLQTAKKSKRSLYFAIETNTPGNPTLYGFLPNGGIKEIWKDKPIF